MSSKVSNFFRQSVAEAVMKLNPEIRGVRLGSIFKGFVVYYSKPNLDETKLSECTYREYGIDRDGSFWLYIESIIGGIEDINHIP
jgi:hypothetical protein